jgi:hypothetical protein
MFGRLLLLIIVASAIAVIFFFVRNKTSLQQVFQIPTPSPSTAANQSLTLGTRTKTSDCIATNELQDKACTPGAIFQNATREQICVKGYTKTVRNVPTSLKQKVYASYVIATHKPGEYEVDHLISLELGGSNDIANLWPEAAEPRPGFHEKDEVENYLHQRVCDGTMTLLQAQQAIANNWLEVYESIPNPQKYDYDNVHTQ